MKKNVRNITTILIGFGLIHSCSVSPVSEPKGLFVVDSLFAHCVVERGIHDEIYTNTSIRCVYHFETYSGTIDCHSTATITYGYDGEGCWIYDQHTIPKAVDQLSEWTFLNSRAGDYSDLSSVKVYLRIRGRFWEWPDERTFDDEPILYGEFEWEDSLTADVNVDL